MHCQTMHIIKTSAYKTIHRDNNNNNDNNNNDN